MRISDTPSADAAGNVQPVATPATKEAQHSLPSGAAEDEVSIGPVALAASKSLEAPEAKLQQLRQQYLDGTYSVDAKDLSGKIVDEHLQK